MMSPDEICELKRASRIVGGAVHPDTGEIIPTTMRLPGFVSFNAPLLAVMLFTRQTPTFNALLQILDQTYIAGINYGNRNASTTYTTNDLLRGYSAAVLASTGIAYFTRTLLQKSLSKLTGSRLLFASAGLNWIAAASAGGLNCALMR